MKIRFIFLLSIQCIIQTLTAQSDKPVLYSFEKEKRIPCGEVENQCNTGTCWSFATISFMESEIMRKSNLKIDLSEMHPVRWCYQKKVESYVLYQGKQQIGPGGLSHDVLYVMNQSGLMPESALKGTQTTSGIYDHGSVDDTLAKYATSIVAMSPLKSPNWRTNVGAMLDEQVGKIPSEFTYEEKKYTPQSFLKYTGLSADDYISITSFTHHPYYRSFVLEVPDNWSKGSFMNVPLDEMVKIIDHALEKGYSIAWDADVSEPGFLFERGLGLLLADKESVDNKIPMKELAVSAERRQLEFENYSTTDDHLMHMMGYANGPDGKRYYIIKNSWGTANPYKGYQYISTPYVAMKTVGIVLHKDAIPADIREKFFTTSK
jgi:bleomycin hydrolase